MIDTTNFIGVFMETKTGGQIEAEAMQRFRVNVIYRWKERWRYPRTLKRAKMLQEQATEQGLHSIISQKINGKYVPIA